MRIDGINQGYLPRSPCAAPPQGIHKVHIIEVGYCNASNWADKRAEKLAQHDTRDHNTDLGNNLRPDLVAALTRTYGPERAGEMVQMHAVPLAVCGFALQANLDKLINLGLDRDDALRCMRKLSRHSMTSLLATTRERHMRCQRALTGNTGIG